MVSGKPKILRIITGVFLFGISFGMLEAQIITDCETRLFLKNSQTARLGKYIINNDDCLPWQKQSEISFVLPLMSDVEWADSRIKLSYKSKEYVVQPLITDKRCDIKIPFEVLSGESIIIDGLSLRNIYFPTKKVSPKIFLNAQPCEFAGFQGRMIKMDPFHQKKLFLDEFAVTDLDFNFQEPGRFITRHQLLALPKLEIVVGARPSFIPKGQTLEILFPSSIAKDIEYKNARINGWYFEKNKKIRMKFTEREDGLCAELVFLSPLNSGDRVIIDNLFINTDRALTEPVSARLRIPKSGGSEIFTKHQLYVADPYAELADNPEAIVNIPSVKLPELFVDAGRIAGGINAISDIYLELPKDLGFAWNRSVNQIFVEGPAADKIADNIHYLDNTTLKIDVLEDFQPDEWLRINGLQFAVKITRGDNLEDLIKAKNFINVYFCGYSEKSGLDILTQEIQIAHFTMTSTEPQVFYYKDLSSETASINFRVESNFSCFEPGDVLILTIPKNLSVEWSNRIGEVYLEGTMKSKVKEVKYLDAKRVGIVLSNSISPRDNLIINGLKTEGFFREGRGELGLYHSASDLPLCVDTEPWIVEKPYFNMGGDLSLFTEQTNRCYELMIKTRKLNNYLKRGSEIWIRIPEQYPVQFDFNHKVCELDENTAKYLSDNLKYISDKIIALTVIKSIPANTTLKIANLWFGVPLEETDQLAQLELSFNRGFSYVPCNKNISIVSTKSRCNKSVHLCSLVKSNFDKGDSLIIKLDDTRFLQWDKKMITNRLKISQPKKYLDDADIMFKNKNRSIIFKLNKAWDINERIDFSGLYVSVKNNRNDLPDKAFITVCYQNNYGLQEYRYHIPASYKEMTPPEKYKRHIPGRTYINPFIKFKSGKDVSLFFEKSDDVLRIPDFYIQNGNVYATDMASYNVFRRTRNNIIVLLEKGQFETARSEAEKLIKDCPGLWKGYWALAKVLKEDKNLINDARIAYQRAKELGFKPGMMWDAMECEAVFIDDPNAEMDRYISDGIKLFYQKEYLAAEEKFLLYTDLIDSLSYEMIGKSNYWLGRVAFALHDYEFAVRYFETARDYDYDPPTVEQQYSVNYLLEDCTRNIEMGLSEEDFYQPDMNLLSTGVYAEQKPVLVTFHKPDNRRDRIVLLRQNQGGKLKTKHFGDTFELYEKDEYTIRFRPVLNSIVRFTSTVLIGAACCAILII